MRHSTRTLSRTLQVATPLVGPLSGGLQRRAFFTRAFALTSAESVRRNPAAPGAESMKKNLALLALALSMTSLASAAEPAAKGPAKKIDTVAAAPTTATSPNAVKVDSTVAKGKAKAESGAAKESAKDPYEVPLLKGARSLNGTW
jgi:hypothetical protein